MHADKETADNGGKSNSFIFCFWVSAFLVLARLSVIFVWLSAVVCSDVCCFVHDFCLVVLVLVFLDHKLIWVFFVSRDVRMGQNTYTTCDIGDIDNVVLGYWRYR
ncbi:hypothetical protein LOTGIDRAFT_237215 [Lottia gigantea]|uniref:Transmembrane protein n=1 Tax=Lottia gigantea TaxID=225164 RepID=V3ZMH6_LOTGI|nr:hypothetical protein LOTGIDRAFT_237215 [Lottia gigantea]ESO82036.1 hypothetical protein LOTGIDRAFT_237215 [Lottia gigantea]